MSCIEPMCPLNPLSRWSLSGKIINIFFYKIKVKTHRFEILFQKNCKIKNFFPTEANIGVPKVQKKVYRTWLIVIKIFFLLYIFACKMIFLILFFTYDDFCIYELHMVYLWILIGLQNIGIVILTISDTLIYIRTFLTVHFLGTLVWRHKFGHIKFFIWRGLVRTKILKRKISEFW